MLAGGEPVSEVLPYSLAFNLFLHNSALQANGYCEEELKMLNETRKIMGLSNLCLSATCVRVPVLRAHSEAVVARFLKPISLEAAKRALEGAAGVRMVDEPKKNLFPMPSVPPIYKFFERTLPACVFFKESES